MSKIDTTYWKEFIVSKYFITEKDGKQVPTGANIPKLELKENGKTPRITVTAINNGVFGYFDYIGDKPCNYRVFRNFVSVSFLGTVFYQKEEASLDMKVHCIKPLNHQLNTYTGMFLVSAIRASLKNYKYSDQLSSTVLPKLKILLPATPAGEPDWRYMEMYMRGVEAIAKNKLSILVPHKPEVAIKEATTVHIDTYNDYSKTFNVEK
jgi:hypothetical protein